MENLKPGNTLDLKSHRRLSVRRETSLKFPFNRTKIIDADDDYGNINSYKEEMQKIKSFELNTVF